MGGAVVAASLVTCLGGAATGGATPTGGVIPAGGGRPGAPAAAAPETRLGYPQLGGTGSGAVTVLHDDGTVTRLPAGSTQARQVLRQGLRAAGSGVRAVGSTQPVTALGAVRWTWTATTAKPKPPPRPSATPTPGFPAKVPTAAEQSRQYFLQQVGAPRAWAAGAAGAGVTVAVIDSGIDVSHPDLAGQVVARVDCTGARGCTTRLPSGTPHWHGTHVAGVIAAAANGTGVVGVAPRARLLDVRVLDASGNGDTAMVTAGVEWAVKRGAKILNLSIGSPGDDPALHAAIRRATARGVLVVVAAGNDFDPCARAVTPSYPAAYPEAVAVAATGQDGTHAWFSSVSGYVDVAAPGAAVISDSPGRQVSPANGTSVATPQVSGVAADVWSAHRTWTAARVRAELLRTAVDLGTPGRDDVFGAGLVQATALPGPAPGQASGVPGLVPASATVVNLSAARTVPYRTPVAVAVTVTAPGRIPACRATVTLQVRDATTPGAPWRTAATLMADPDGAVSGKVTVDRTTALRAVVSGASWLPPVTTQAVELRMVPVLRLSARRAGGTLAVTVRTAPAARLGLALQRFDRARQVWVTVARGTTDARGCARFGVPAGSRSATLRVISSASPGWPASTSATLSARLAP